ncbi:hypothetical protein [Thiomicrorhabdus xiamenensis]|uniref:Uncharacterized protein n=1 Tax=Thiomicrorhabdus xiamenensis TaxID=2739063 RepID=A0A7D4NYI5_9GAMM|nr:hypothetical protein [Thiomicrorhabdus xiamenensis]QKI89158.1 hypothetical protein HQN79_06055 [Thiomicrorhabdus xiamenensis]
MLLCFSAPSVFAEPLPPKQVRFLGLEVAKLTQKQVRQQLWQIGGFKFSRSSLKQHNIDKFFTQTRLADSYSVTFYYNDLGEVTRFRRLYRPYSTQGDNNGRLLNTQRVAHELSKELGPAQVQRKGWGGFAPYLSYSWQDEEVAIHIDRVGEHPMGEVFIEYRIIKHDPYAVKDEQNPNVLPSYIRNAA